MVIADSLRQEDMPEMVYALCRLSTIEHSKEKIKELITLQDQGKSSSDQFNHVFNFAENCGFISIDDNGLISPEFSSNDLVDYRHFRYAVFKSVFHDSDTKFSLAAKWYMSEDIPKNMSKNDTIFSITTGSEFLRRKPDNLTVDENFFNGFRFWMTALGLTSFYAPGTATTSRPPLLFAAHNIIKDWLVFDMPLNEGNRYSFRSFAEQLVDACPVFSDCVDFKKNTLASSVSAALRVLNNSGLVELIRVNDAGDVWHLSNSIYYSKTNNVTHIEFKGER